MESETDGLVDIGGTICSLAAFSGEQCLDSATDSFPMRRMVSARFQSGILFWHHRLSLPLAEIVVRIVWREQTALLTCVLNVLLMMEPQTWMI